MFPLFQIGPVALQIPGLILLAAFWISLNFMEKEANRLKQPPEAIYGLTMTALVGGIIGGRLWYVASYWQAYLDDPLGIISLNTNTVDMTAALVIGIAAGFLYGRWKKLPLRPTLDILAIGLAFMGIGLGLSHLSSGNAFGSQTDLPWAIYLWDANRHPAQIYEMLLAAGVFLILWRMRQATPYPGFLFLAWMALTAVSRLFLEAFRGDSIIVAGGIRQTQLLALLALLAALWLMRQWAAQTSMKYE
jgi:prolipoprotein diacylglyceryltransferase